MKKDPIIKDLKVVDNYEAARALDRFHRTVVKPLTDRVDKGWDYIIKDSPSLPEAEKKKQQSRYDALKLQLDEMENFYNATKTLIMRHENMVNEIARIKVGIRENLLWEGLFPKELMDEQVKFMNEYYQILVTLLKDIDL